MKKRLWMMLLLTGVLVFCLWFFMNLLPDPINEGEENNEQQVLSGNEDDGFFDEEDLLSIQVAIGSELFEAKLYPNEVAQSLIAQMPLTVNMADLNGNEKYANLSESFSSVETERPTMIYEGELMIWSANTLVLFNDTFVSSYGGYVRVGYIEDPTGLATALGTEQVTVTFMIL